VRFAINAPNFGSFANPRVTAELATAAEAAGWDGFFLWDHILSPQDQLLGDTWTQLAAIAARTSTIKLGPIVTPLPRRRPEVIARQAVALDHLSNGRLVMGVGLGDDWLREFSAFDGAVDDRQRGAMLDEALDVLAGLWSGKPFSFNGTHYKVHNATFLPRPVQQPRIPIWIAGHWPAPRPFRRAARWDGAVLSGQGNILTPTECRDVHAFIQKNRTTREPFDMVIAGEWSTSAASMEASNIDEYAAAGVTWYQMPLSPNESLESALTKLRFGPPGVH
jgi:alkanesulfonate monooxygenase SsuD/methylene tetrahydromethanopterin reductase-like flavin-dependent oxidoreductase (luciferase family)